jgi:predicted regulator of amino acid metabolism with ACT domain
MGNPVWSKIAQEIEIAENKIACAIGMIREVERMAELVQTDEQRQELLKVLKAANHLKQQALKERDEAGKR